MNPIALCRAEVRRSQARTAYVDSNYRTAISLLHEAQEELASNAGQTPEWWSLRATEAHNHRMRGDHDACIAVALGGLADGVEIDADDHVGCAIDLLSSCIETKPLGLIEKLMDEIFSAEWFSGYKRAECLRHYVQGLLAQRQGNPEVALLRFARSWELRKAGYSSGYTRMVHLVKCAEMAAWLGKEEELAQWIGVMERISFEIPCDEVRLRHARVLALRMKPATPAVAATMREIALGGLRILASRAERVHYWNYACGLLYGLGAAGDRVGVEHYAAAYSGGPTFERVLWSADQAWFAAAAEAGLPHPRLAPAPLVAQQPFRLLPVPAGAGRLIATYREIEGIAANEDARLGCEWRRKLIASRIAWLDGDS